MEPRQPPFSRPERSLIQNPNYQSTPQSQPPYTAYAPPTSQPHPYADPYAAARRDPFLPAASQHSRQGSYGAHHGEGAASSGPAERPGGWGHAAPPVHHHASPSGHPLSMSNNAPSKSYGYDSTRKGQVGGASPPNPYGAPSHDPPPPPSFARSHMPPPSSPQQQNHAPPAHRVPYPPSSFAAARELPGLGTAHRPGSSMSISSLIGSGDTASHHQPPPSLSSANPPTSAPPPNHSMQPPSPRRGLASGSRPEYQPSRRPRSPERLAFPGGVPRAAEGHGYPAGSPTRSYSNHGSPEQGRSSLPQSSQPYKPMTFQSSRPYTYSPNDSLARDSRQASSSIPPRPNSQPMGPQGPPDQEPRPPYDNLGARRSAYEQAHEARRRTTLGDSHHTRPNVGELLRGAPPSSTDKDRPVTVQPVSHSAFSPPRDPRGVDGPHPPPGLWRHSSSEDAPRETTEIRREEPPALYRGAYGSYQPPSQTHAPYGPHGEDPNRGRSLDHLSSRAVEQYHAGPTSDPHAADRQKAEQLSRSLSSGGRSLYEQPRRMGEEMQPSKSFLGLSAEANRRTGRASPLPQAVQGAQAQPVSIGKDPSIKSEFGRMFSGLGSGLGSTTPSRQSPMPGVVDNIPPGPDFTDMRMQRVSSQTGRKPKRVKDEDGIFDTESIDGRGTPSLTGRGAKRNKYTHTTHHHHHHPHTHHHHHHHHKPDEEMPPHAPSANSTPFSAQRLSNSATNGAAGPPSHHHHHHHAAAHHHHHPTRPSQPIALQITPRVHDIQAVLDEAAKLPRRHLGSHLYEASPTLPAANSQSDEVFSYESKPRPLPRFDSNPVNCTITIRVPRYYLTARQRQQIVLQKHLWGARIYRDDSDPIAAAMHSGWIRGEWHEEVDVNMLDPRITAPSEASDAEPLLTKLPAAPVVPPADMELHLTLLILPKLQEYEKTTEYGISSRRSKNHDGLSFMIHQMQWVEEGYGTRGHERGAAALKRRLDAGRALLSLGNTAARVHA